MQKDSEFIVTPARTIGYTFIGLPRDILDTPFALVNRLLFFQTEKEVGILGFRIQDKETKNDPHDPTAVEASLASSVLASAVVSSHAAGTVSAAASLTLPSASILVQTFAATFASTAAFSVFYPVTISPLADTLLRYPHNSSNMAIGYRKLKEEENYAYFPNIDLFFSKEKIEKPSDFALPLIYTGKDKFAFLIYYKSKSQQILFPFFWNTLKEEKKISRCALFPLISKKEESEGKISRKKVKLFPLLWWEKDYLAKESFFGFFPFFSIKYSSEGSDFSRFKLGLETEEDKKEKARKKSKQKNK